MEEIMPGFHVTEEAVQHLISLDRSLKGALEKTVALLEDGDAIDGGLVVSLHAEHHAAAGWTVVLFSQSAYADT